MDLVSRRTFVKGLAAGGAVTAVSGWPQAAAAQPGQPRSQDTLRGTAFRDPKSYFHRYSTLSDKEASNTASSIWNRINLVNLHDNILPTRQRADLILKKGENHAVEEVALRRL